MAIAVQQMHPVAHLPLVLGVLRRLEVATVIDHLIPPHPAHGLSCGRGVEAMVLAMLDGHHALYKVGNWRNHNPSIYMLEAKAIRRTIETRRRCAPMGAGFTWSPWQASRGPRGRLPVD
jgi:hypothetical protein